MTDAKTDVMRKKLPFQLIYSLTFYKFTDSYMRIILQ